MTAYQTYGRYRHDDQARLLELIERIKSRAPTVVALTSEVRSTASAAERPLRVRRP